MPRPLNQHPCQDACDWRPSGEVRDSDLIFTCAGCASQWTRGEGWRPKNLDGSIARAVQDELSR